MYQKIMLCAGTRPEIIKMAPVYHALAAKGETPLLLHTGQHEEMAWPLYDFFGMSPTQSLSPRRRGNSLATLNASVLEQAGDAIEDARPDAVLVQGDTTSAQACALAAYYLNIPVGHVEAGLRTGLRDPFPEEKNRELIGRLAEWHFAPTPQAERNLAREGVTRHVHCVGNTAVDAVLLGSRRLSGWTPGNGAERALLGFLEANPRKSLILVTAHRRENWGEPILRVARAVRSLVERRADVCVVWPLHANPILRALVLPELDALAATATHRLLATEPLNYPALLFAMNRAGILLTDSGGIQEEAATLHKPVLVMRESTERQELIDAGGGLLVGTDQEAIEREVIRLLDDDDAREAMEAAPNPFGDGRAAERIRDILNRGDAACAG